MSSYEEGFSVSRPVPLKVVSSAPVLVSRTIMMSWLEVETFVPRPTNIKSPSLMTMMSSTRLEECELAKSLMTRIPSPSKVVSGRPVDKVRFTIMWNPLL